jgi:hypothetical protein
MFNVQPHHNNFIVSSILVLHFNIHTKGKCSRLQAKNCHARSSFVLITYLLIYKYRHHGQQLNTRHFVSCINTVGFREAPVRFRWRFVGFGDDGISSVHFHNYLEPAQSLKTYYRVQTKKVSAVIPHAKKLLMLI